jgi:polysaccharide export outer membrane protein
MIRRTVIAGMVLCWAGVLAPQAQQPVRDPSPASPAVQEDARQPVAPTLKLNPMEAIRRFEPAEDEEYRLGKGDEIAVDFSGRPEMQIKTVIGPDGRITVPLAGEVMLRGLTRAEAAKSIEGSLASYYANLTVQVSVTKYTANRVLVLGAVEHPGMVLFDGTPTLLETLTRGGLMVGTSKVAQLPERCAIYRGSDQVLWVELRAMIESGNAMADMRLRRDDVVYVPDISERFVSVLGEVQHPGGVPLTHKSTMATVLADAGGLTEKAGGNPRIQIVDPASGTTRTVMFKDLLNPAKSLEVTLRPGEIIYVPRSGFNRATYVLERLSPVLSLATLVAYAGVL